MAVEGAEAVLLNFRALFRTRRQRHAGHFKEQVGEAFLSAIGGYSIRDGEPVGHVPRASEPNPAAINGFFPDWPDA
jgi:hypothetical protein